MVDPSVAPATAYESTHVEDRAASVDACPTDAGDSLDAWRARVTGTNINPTTLLATDYLNHFNEIVMTLEMVPDMPDLIEDAKEWRPRTYEEHFRRSSIADKDLAIEVYPHVPTRFLAAFEDTVHRIDETIATTICALEADMAGNDLNVTRENTAIRLRGLRRLLDAASAIIHGAETTLDQREIDNLFV